ncbi:hypothetical protein [Aromatoleum petrolei]|uniref:Transmembrane protein n=1 Tax=Aromatoleum petrolei TaxID=76116 RepID=A0ABX1MZ91_9RHOO|nr:hypothetical protein [Aromatoleum petrolei]NMF91616.1 hypothetical protein [Aromatoleum petrolei]
MQWGAIVFAGTLWCWLDLRDLRRRVTAKGYVEHEFIEFEDHVALRSECKTNLDAPPVTDKTLLGRLWHRHGTQLFVAIAPLASAGYAISRVADSTGGIEAVLLVLAVLGLPLLLWFFSKVVCGFYLHVYLVYQIERRSGKPVLLQNGDRD